MGKTPEIVPVGAATENAKTNPICPVDGCGTSYRDPLVMQRHMTRVHGWPPQPFEKSKREALLRAG